MVELTQSELAREKNKGSDYILNYRTVYEIVWSHGAQGYVQRKTRHVRNGLALTKRGRFIFATRTQIQQLLGVSE